VEASKFVLDHPHMWEESTVQQFSIPVSMLDLGVTKMKHQVLPEYKIFIHKVLI